MPFDLAEPFAAQYMMRQRFIHGNYPFYGWIKCGVDDALPYNTRVVWHLLIELKF